MGLNLSLNYGSKLRFMVDIVTRDYSSWGFINQLYNQLITWGHHGSIRMG